MHTVMHTKIFVSKPSSGHIRHRMTRRMIHQQRSAACGYGGRSKVLTFVSVPALPHREMLDPVLSCFWASRIRMSPRSQGICGERRLDGGADVRRRAHATQGAGRAIARTSVMLLPCHRPAVVSAPAGFCGVLG